MPIDATFPVVQAAAADTARRTVGGIAVPWNVEGRVSSGEIVVFHPGALQASARPVLLRDHDRTRTIGRVTDAADDGRQMQATSRVSATPLGDETLVLAGDGALMFSVGAEPTRFDYDDRGRLHVYEADWNELTLLPLGAYTGAVVTTVTAAQPEGEPMPPITATDTPDPELPDAPPPPDDDDDDETTPEVPPVETTAEVVPLAAARGVRAARAARRGPYDHLTLRQVAQVIAASRGADPGAVRLRDAVLAAQGSAVRGIEAALADVTMVGTSNVGGAYRPAYQAELVEIISWGTPLIDVLRQGDLERGDYPNKSFNSWSTTPEVALQAAEKDEIHSVPVHIVPASAPVQTWAGGNDISQQTLDFGSPSFVEDYIRAAGVDYAKKSDTYAVVALTTAALDVPTLATDSFIDVVGKLIGALNPATTPPGGLFLAVAYDVAVGLIGVPRDQGPAFWDGQVNFGTMTPEVTTNAGLTVFCDPNLAPRNYLAGHRQGATWYDLPGTPFNLRAVNVGLLGLDVAVYGYGALGIQYPGAFTKTVQPVA